MKQEIENIIIEADNLKSELDSLNGKIELLDNQITNNDIKLESIIHDRGIFKKSVEILNAIQDTTKKQIKTEFENLVTFALESIFGEGYKFEIEFGKRGNLKEVNFNIITPNLNKSFDPKDVESGLILDVVALALKIVLCGICENQVSNILVLDEPFKHISLEYRENAMMFLKEISKKMNKQMIIVTHNEYFSNNADKEIKIG